ncbi:hypothetical protein TNIN_28531 [Trichonephila inaurata madagascariensis]|uniref:Uncharacterized protein n=1 Tax=Trichonephila inaurata madagascariensis TaxID=2747483 RepID=A0A8X7BXM6_9ARAC|nr:hypothetical protein TNIN_28531 [Trichonephila inaurata madagascariensis]
MSLSRLHCGGCYATFDTLSKTNWRLQTNRRPQTSHPPEDRLLPAGPSSLEEGPTDLSNAPSPHHESFEGQACTSKGLPAERATGEKAKSRLQSLQNPENPFSGVSGGSLLLAIFVITLRGRFPPFSLADLTTEEKKPWSNNRGKTSKPPPNQILPCCKFSVLVEGGSRFGLLGLSRGGFLLLTGPFDPNIWNVILNCQTTQLQNSTKDCFPFTSPF